MSWRAPGIGATFQNASICAAQRTACVFAQATINDPANLARVLRTFKRAPAQSAPVAGTTSAQRNNEPQGDVMSKLATRFLNDESGATAIEYGLIAAIVGIGI